MQERPNIIDDIIEIFIRADQPEVQDCVMAILERSSEGHGEQLLIYSNPEMFSNILQLRCYSVQAIAAGCSMSLERRAKHALGALR